MSSEDHGFDTTTAALTLMASIGMLGLSFNIMGTFVIYRNPLLHNTFGLLCFSHLISNVVALFCFSILPLIMIISEDNHIAQTSLGKRFGRFAVTCWWSSLLAHMVISINRFVCIVFPLKSNSWFTMSNTKIVVSIIWIAAFIITLPYFWEEDCYLALDARTFQWTYSDHSCGNTLSSFDFFGGAIACSFAFLMDMFTLSRLRGANRTISTDAQLSHEMVKRRKVEVRFFFQAFFQCIVFCVTLLSFHVFSLFSGNLWWQFAMVTVVWQSAHSADGLIVVLFHFRWVLCSKKRLTSTIIVNHSSTVRVVTIGDKVN